jgi:hypothetical protein
MRLNTTPVPSMNSNQRPNFIGEKLSNHSRGDINRSLRRANQTLTFSNLEPPPGLETTEGLGTDFVSLGVAAIIE